MRTAETFITDAEIAHLSEIVEHYRKDTRVPVIHRQMASVEAKRFLTRAVRAMPLSVAEQAEVQPRLRRIA